MWNLKLIIEAALYPVRIHEWEAQHKQYAATNKLRGFSQIEWMHKTHNS